MRVAPRSVGQRLARDQAFAGRITPGGAPGKGDAAAVPRLPDGRLEELPRTAPSGNFSVWTFT
jgi:hypothetical protein